MRKKIILILFIPILVLFNGCDKEDVKIQVESTIDSMVNTIDTKIIQSIKDYVEEKKLEISKDVVQNIQNYISEKYSDLKSIENIVFDVDKHYK